MHPKKDARLSLVFFLKELLLLLLKHSFHFDFMWPCRRQCSNLDDFCRIIPKENSKRFCDFYKVGHLGMSIKTGGDVNWTAAAAAEVVNLRAKQNKTG